jgi:long-chain acyl-CoA synthetase
LYLTGRKSQIIKTSTGRRIDPVRSEAVYNHSPFVDQLVIVGNARPYLGGLVSLHEAAVRSWLEGNGHILDTTKRLDQLPAVRHLIRQELDRLGATLAEHERVVDFAILPQPLDIERGELTPTFKLRRTQIETRYARLIDALYACVSPGATANA